MCLATPDAKLSIAVLADKTTLFTAVFANWGVILKRKHNQHTQYILVSRVNKYLQNTPFIKLFKITEMKIMALTITAQNTCGHYISEYALFNPKY